MTFIENTWSALSTGVTSGQGTNARINAMTIAPNGHVYVCGFISVIGGVSVSSVAYWDGEQWAAVGNPGATGPVAIGVDSTGKVYVGSRFGTVPLTVWDGQTWNPVNVNGIVLGIEVDSNDNVYVSGSFTTIDGVQANNIAKWDGQAWSSIGYGLPGIIDCITTDSNDYVYACGGVSSDSFIKTRRVSRLNGTIWETIGTDLDNNAASIKVDSLGKIYVGGDFTSFVLYWNGSAWESMGSTVTHPVASIAIDSENSVYVGGFFNIVGSNALLKWKNDAWVTQYGSFSDKIHSIVVDVFDNVFVGGAFTSIDNQEFNRVARWNVNPIVAQPPPQLTPTQQLIESLLGLQPGNSFPVDIINVVQKNAVVEGEPNPFYANSDNWSSSSSVGFTTVAIVNDGKKPALRLLYNGDGSQTGSFGFQTISNRSETLTFDWSNHSVHSWVSSSSFIGLWVNTPSNVIQTLRTGGGESVVSGTSSFEVQVNTQWGFTITGSHSDSSNLLRGQIDIFGVNTFSGIGVNMAEVGMSGLSNSLIISDATHVLTMTNRTSFPSDVKVYASLFNAVSRTTIRNDPIAVQFAVMFVDSVNKEFVSSIQQNYTMELPSFGSHPYLDIYKELENGSAVFITHAVKVSNTTSTYSFSLSDNSVYSVSIPSDTAIYVSPTGSNSLSVGVGSFNTPYRTITYAVQRAQNGSVIEVLEGEYAESINVTKELVINGVNKDMPANSLKNTISKTRLVGRFSLSASNITINGFEIDGNGSGIGIESRGPTTNNNIVLKSNWVHRCQGIRRGMTISLDSSTIVNNWTVHDNYVEQTINNNAPLLLLTMIDGIDIQNNIVVSNNLAHRREGVSLNSVKNVIYINNSVSCTIDTNIVSSSVAAMNARYCLTLANQFTEISNVVISNSEFKDAYIGIVMNGNNNVSEVSINNCTFDNLFIGVHAGSLVPSGSTDPPTGEDNPDIKLTNVSVIQNTFNLIQQYAHYLGPSSDSEFFTIPFDADPYVNYRILNNTYNVHSEHAIHIYNGTLYKPWVIFSDSQEAVNPDGVLVETKFRYKHTFTRTPGGRLQKNLILMTQGSVPVFQLSRFSFLNNNNVQDVVVRDVILYPVGTPGFFESLISNPNTQVVDLTSIIGIFPTLGMEITLSRKSSTSDQISTETVIDSLQHRLVLLNASSISSSIVRMMAIFSPIYKTHIEGKPIVLQFVVKYIDTVNGTIVDNFPQNFRIEIPTLANRQFLKVYREGADGNSYFVTNALSAIENSSSASFYTFTLDFNSVYSVVDSGALVSESGIGSDPHVKTLSGNHWVMNTIRGKNREVQILQDDNLKMVGHIQGYVNGDFLSNVRIIDSKTKAVKCEIDFNKRKINICDPRFASVISDVNSSEVLNSNNSRKGRQTLLVNGFNPGGMYMYIDWNHRYVCPIFNQVIQNKKLKGILV